MDASRQPHLLVLDPNAAICALLVAVVRRHGFQVTACGTGGRATEECRRRERYAAVILSTDMPQADALLRELRRPPRDRSPKIILTTTSNATENAADADHVLLKPFHLDELQAAIAASTRGGEDDRIHLRPEAGQGHKAQP